MSCTISVVVNTLNEEKNIPYALRSVRSWADEIVVVDMHSQDRTVDIARQFGAKVYLHDGPGFQYAPREFAVAQASCEWTLVLDADELVPVKLSRELKRVAECGYADVVIVPRENYSLGSLIRYTGWGPEDDAHARFFRRGYLVASSRVHHDFELVPGARVTRLAYQEGRAIIHFNYLDSEQFIEKLNRYTTLEAREAQARGERASRGFALLHAAKEFAWRYWKRRGYRDGWRGFYLSLFMAFYRLASCAKLTELAEVGGRRAAERLYHEEAERILDGYVEGAKRATAG
jgi:glycosyltransferase involved in cell wall biosynthesis